jgi:hypothetical protein
MGAIPFITRDTLTGVATNRIRASCLHMAVISIGRTFIDVYMKHDKKMLIIHVHI